MPFLQQNGLVGLNQFGQFVQLVGSKAIITSQGKWLEPELGLFIITFHMDVGRLSGLAGVEMKAIGSKAENGGHDLSVSSFLTLCGIDQCLGSVDLLLK